MYITTVRKTLIRFTNLFVSHTSKNSLHNSIIIIVGGVLLLYNFNYLQIFESK